MQPESNTNGKPTAIVADESAPHESDKKRHVLLRAGTVALNCWIWFSVGLFALWATGALFFMDYLPAPIRWMLAIGFLVGSIVLIVKSKQKQQALAIVAGGIVVVWVLWSFVRPSQQRDWATDQQELSRVWIGEDDVVTIENFRHIEYRTADDFDVAYRTESFRADQIESVWYLVQQFSVIDGLAHTFLTFGIRDGEETRYVAVSVEIRREKDESFSTLLGIFKRYEIAYVVGDERDLIGVRTNVRQKDKVYLYRTNASIADAQNMFRSIARRTILLNEQAEFYHTLLNNCTNNIVAHTNDTSPVQVSAYQLQIILPGYSDRVAYNRGLIGKDGEDFVTMRDRCRIDKVAKKVGLTEGFSEAIRAGIDAK